MGILNTTPDSFFDGNKYRDVPAALAHTEKMLNEGADFIDVGGYSSRPRAEHISVEEELHRAIPVIEAIKERFPHTVISIDTFRGSVARAALNAGAVMINDISGGDLDPEMITLLAETQVPYVMMHMRGTPQTMSGLTSYSHLTKEINDHLHKKIYQLESAGVKDLVVDPGFGFAKTGDQNFELLNNLDQLTIHGKPILVGLSRKSMIWRTLQITPEDALNGTTALHMIALLKGANILRVHDVKEAKECIQLFQALHMSERAAKKPE